jgi:1-acyl-sn-glycerol-3-phosphate acyltransferase
MKALISAFLWIVGSFLAFAAILSSIFFAVVLFPFDKQRKMVHAQCFWLADAVMGLSPSWRLSITGLENIDRARTYVIISNHQSMADIIVMYKTRMQFKWIAKESLYRVPFISAFLLLGRHIMLSKCSRGRSKIVYKKVSQYLRDGMSVFFFPEGTRSETGKVGMFQNGAFKMAIKEQVPILPIFIDGTRNVIQKGSWLLNTKASGRMVVFPPIDTAGLGCKDLADIKNAVYARFEKYCE